MKTVNMVVSYEKEFQIEDHQTHDDALALAYEILSDNVGCCDIKIIDVEEPKEEKK